MSSARLAALPSAGELQRKLLESLERAESRQGVPKRGSSAGSGDSESVGVTISSGGPYTGIAGFESAYTPFSVPQTGTSPQIEIGYPTGASGTSLLTAPLLLPSNGSCLAPTMLYDSAGVSTTALFVAFDFCTGTFDFAMPLNDSSLVRQYMGSVNGVPGFYTVTLTLDKQPTSSSRWHLLIYNYALSRFDVVTSKVGLNARKRGLAVFHSQFVAGQCPVTPPIAASALQLYNATSGKFETLLPTMTGATSTVLPVTASDSCFNSDVTGAASFTLALLNSNWSWQVSPQVPPVSINEYTSGITSGSYPSYIAAGPDGNLWFTEANIARIARITPGGSVTEFSSGITAGSYPQGITAGPDGNLWFTEQGSTQGIGRITPSGTVSEFSSGITGSSYPNAIAAGPDGNLWFTEDSASKIGRITPSGTVTEFSSGITANSTPYGITAGPDGNLWFTEYSASRIGRITPSGSVTEFSSGITAADGLITAGPDGNLWFTEISEGRIGRITPAGVVTEFSSGITANSGPLGIAAGPDGNLWFTELNANQVGRITPGGVVTEFSSGIAGSGPIGITDGADGNLWFAENIGNRIGRVVP